LEEIEMEELEPLVTADEKGLVESFSPEAVELFGWWPDEVVGRKRLSSFHRKEDLAELLPKMMGTAD
jgi:PAS domain S-box-containing protein